MSRITVDRRAHELQCKAHGELLEEIARLRTRVRALEEGLRRLIAHTEGCHLLITLEADCDDEDHEEAAAELRAARTLLEASDE